MDLIYFLKVLYRRKWLILIITLVSVVATFFITTDTNKVFKSSAKLATGIVDNPETEGKYIPQQQIDAKFNNLIEIISSRTVVNLVAYKLIRHDLEEPEAFRNGVKLRDDYSKEILDGAAASFRAKSDSLGTISFSSEKDKILLEILTKLEYDYDNLREVIKLERMKNSDYINVEAQTENPDLSAFLVNTLCSEFIRYYQSIQSDKKSGSVVQFTNEVDEKIDILNRRKSELNQFKLNNGIVNLSEQSSSILGQIRDLELRREDEKKKIPSYKQAIESMNQNQRAGEATFTELQKKNKNINNLRSEINYLNDKYISGGSKDKELFAQIQQLKAELAVLINEVQKTSTTSTDPNIAGKKIENEFELDMAQSSVYSMDKEIQRLKNELSVLVSLEPSISSMEREISMAETDYLNAVNKLSASKSASMSADNALRQVEFGMPATSPEPTKQIFYSIFSGLLSLSFCIVMMFVLEYVDLSIKTPMQFEKATNLKLLGYLNQINFISFNLDVNFIDLNLESIFHNKSDNKQLETFKQLIRKIRFEVESSESKRFLFTSVREGEGKTFFLISLAYTLSLNNKNVLLIDTNFKNNTLTKMLGARPALEKHFNQGAVKQDIISKSKLKGIDVVGCYEGNYSPSEVFSQTNFQDLINNMEKDYDFIFLEGAALNEYADSKELISSVEKVITIFGTGIVIKDQDKASIAYLRGLGEKFMGAVLNKVEMSNLA